MGIRKFGFPHSSNYLLLFSAQKKKWIWVWNNLRERKQWHFIFGWTINISTENWHKSYDLLFGLKLNIIIVDRVSLWLKVSKFSKFIRILTFISLSSDFCRCFTIVLMKLISYFIIKLWLFFLLLLQDDSTFIENSFIICVIFESHILGFQRRASTFQFNQHTVYSAFHHLFMFYSSGTMLFVPIFWCLLTLKRPDHCRFHIERS